MHSGSGRDFDFGPRGGGRHQGLHGFDISGLEDVVEFQLAQLVLLTFEGSLHEKFDRGDFVGIGAVNAKIFNMDKKAT